jgi:hypothetical protein
MLIAAGVIAVPPRVAPARRRSDLGAARLTSARASPGIRKKQSKAARAAQFTATGETAGDPPFLTPPQNIS